MDPQRAEIAARARGRLEGAINDEMRPDIERPQGFVVITRNPDTAGNNAGNVSFVDGTNGHLLEALEATRALYHEATGTASVPFEYRKLIEAIRTVNRLHNLGDAIYAVRSRAAESMPAGDGDSWHEPTVTEYSNAIDVLRKLGAIQ